MAAARAELAKVGSGRFHPFAESIRRMRDDADEAVLGDRTGCPARIAVRGEPVVRGVVMDVIA